MRLSEKQKQFYKDNGYIVLKNVLSEKELTELIEEYDKLFKRQNMERIENSWVGTDENDRQHDGIYTVKGVHNLHYHHALFTKYLLNENLLDAFEDILGTPNIALHHTKAHFKPPEKGAAYPMHQDYPYFPYEKDSMIAAFLHLDAATPENGGLCVYPGSHKLGPQEDIGAKEGNYHYVDQTKFPLEGATPVIAERGDIVIFSYLLVHGSPINSSTKPRRMLLLQVYDAHDKPIGAQTLCLSQGLMLRGGNYYRDGRMSKRFDVY